MKRMKLKALSVFIAVVMIAALLPAAAFAADEAGDYTVTEITDSSEEVKSSAKDEKEAEKDGNLPADGENTEKEKEEEKNLLENPLKGAVLRDAGTEYGIWVGGVQATSENLSGEGWSYEPETNTLTLTDANISTTYLYPNPYIYEIIYIYAESDLNIILSGTNVISGSDKEHGMGIVIDGSLAISGNGSLEITDTYMGCSAKKTMISGGTFDITSTYAAIVANRGLEVSGGSITAKAEDGNGILVVNDGMTVSGGSIKAEGSEGGIRVIKNSIEGAFAVSGGTITAKGGNYGIYSYSDLNITGGTITADATEEGKKAVESINGTITLGENVEIFEPEEGKLSEDKKTINIGSVPANHVELSTNFQYDLLVGGVWATTKNASDILGDGGTAAYDPETNTLTLTDANIPTVYTESGYINYNCGIYSGGDINIALSGTNTITCSDTENYLVFGIYAPGSIVFSGNGSLKIAEVYQGVASRYVTISEGKFDISSSFDSISAVNMTISGGTVTARSAESYGILAEKTLTISGGTIDTEGQSNGIRVSEFEISGGMITARATSGTGIDARGNLTISGGTITAEGGNYGICVCNDLDITGGNLTAKNIDNGMAVYSEGGSISYPEGYLWEPEGGRVTASGYFVDEDDIIASKVVIVKPYNLYCAYIENGGLYVSRENAPAGTEIYVEAWPNAFYEIDKVTYQTGNGEKTDITDTMKFIMPEDDVIVRAVFKAMVLEGIEITKEPDKTEYKCEESFDRAGMIVTAAYNGGTTINVTSDVTVSPEKFTFGDTKVTVSYELNGVTLTADQPVTVFHDLKETRKAEPKCEEAGHEAYWTCEGCNKMFSDKNGMNEITEPAAIPAAGHKLEKVDEVPAKCEEDGYEAYWKCTECGKMFSDENGRNEIMEIQVIKAPGHDWGEWIVTKPATASAEGEETRFCTRDERHFETRPVDKLSFIAGDVNGDGKTNAKDKAILNRYLAGWKGYEALIISWGAADINKDGEVTAKDKAILNRYLAGWNGYDKYFR